MIRTRQQDGIREIILDRAQQRNALNEKMPLADALTMDKQLNALLLASGRIDEASRAFAERRKR